MSFSAAWLALREPADRAARDPALLSKARDWLRSGTDPLAVDLGSGTGSTVRAFGPTPARWTLVDNDPALLMRARDELGGSVGTMEADLSDVAALPLGGARLVTASALFDLAGPALVEAIATRVIAEGAALYAALSYDGVMEWSPGDAEDLEVTVAFNRHQRRDKGLGPALGPDAASFLEAEMRRHGYEVVTGTSPWILDASSVELQMELLAGIAGAAAETGLDPQRWLARRREHLGSGICRIGHVDLLALPPA